MQSFRIPDLTYAQLQKLRHADAAQNGKLSKYDAAFQASFPVAASLAASSSGGGWDPRFVPAIVAGYWWDRTLYSGLGTAGFTIPEQNGNTAFDRELRQHRRLQCAGQSQRSFVGCSRYHRLGCDRRADSSRRDRKPDELH